MPKDFLKEYKKNKILNNITIVIASLVIALGINFFVIDNSGLGSKLKADIIESTQNTQKADLYLTHNNLDIFLKNSKNLNNIKALSFSLIYNPKNIKLGKLSCNNKKIIKIENTPGIVAFIIKYNNENIVKNSSICKLSITKKENKTEHLNLINSNFSDSSGEIYLLSTSGITF